MLREPKWSPHISPAWAARLLAPPKHDILDDIGFDCTRIGSERRASFSIAQLDEDTLFRSWPWNSPEPLRNTVTCPASSVTSILSMFACSIPFPWAFVTSRCVLSICPRFHANVCHAMGPDSLFGIVRAPFLDLEDEDTPGVQTAFKNSQIRASPWGQLKSHPTERKNASR